MSGLKLSALDADDLAVISAAVQDALVAVRDCAYFKDERRFVLLLNRFRWEADPTVEAAHSRTHSALVFNEVTAVRLTTSRSATPTACWNCCRGAGDDRSVTLRFAAAGHTAGNRPACMHLGDVGSLGATPEARPPVE